jgi:hypothetical protein
VAPRKTEIGRGVDATSRAVEGTGLGLAGHAIDDSNVALDHAVDPEWAALDRGAGFAGHGSEHTAILLESLEVICE